MRVFVWHTSELSLLDHVEKGWFEFKGIDVDGGCLNTCMDVGVWCDEVTDGSRVVVCHWDFVGCVNRGGGVVLSVGNWL